MTNKSPEKKAGLKSMYQTIIIILAIFAAGVSFNITVQSFEADIKDSMLSEEEVTDIAITAAETVMYKHEVADVQEAAEAVLATLEKSGIRTPNEINEFLAEKPAGKTDLSKGINNIDVYTCLVEIYGELAKNAKIALN